MKKDEQGFMDWLVEDICNTIEIKGAVEATRDENGKVDKWAATGLAMGLGHTSDDELATLAGFLGAEGAFDNDYFDGDSDCDDIADDYFYGDSILGDSDYNADRNVVCSPLKYTVNHSAVSHKKVDSISKDEYEKQRKSITSEKAMIITASVISILVFSVSLLNAMKLYPEGTGLYFFMLLVIDASLVYGIIHTSKTSDKKLSDIESKYYEGLRNEVRKNETEKK